MTTDPLSLLRAGLDEDERIARAACDAARADTEGDASRWFVDEEEGRESAGVTSGFPQRVVGRPGGANGVVVYDEGYPHVEQARHIARQDPKATLDRVEAIRKVIAEREAEHTRVQVSDPVVRAYGDGYRAAYDRIAGILASIYAPEPTDETEKP